MNRKKLFEEYYDDHWKVLDELRGYMIDKEDSVNSIAIRINISSMTLSRILRKNNRMVFSTWCKIKKFLQSEIK